MITLVTSKPYMTIDGNVTVSKATFSMDYSAALVGSKQSLQKYETAAKSMNALVGATDSYAGSSVITLIMAIDPTGTLLKFAQILKIINKIRFFNINFGSRL
jgi:hypothetical protein